MVDGAVSSRSRSAEPSGYEAASRIAGNGVEVVGTLASADGCAEICCVCEAADASPSRYARCLEDSERVPHLCRSLNPSLLHVLQAKAARHLCRRAHFSDSESRRSSGRCLLCGGIQCLRLAQRVRARDPLTGRTAALARAAAAGQLGPASARGRSESVSARRVASKNALLSSATLQLDHLHR